MPNPFPIGVWFQPILNFSKWKARGCNFVLGPELGDPPITTPNRWAEAAAAVGLDVAGNFDYRPPNLKAWFVPIDEPNAHAVTVDQVKAYVTKFTALDSNLPILISLAGDKISSADATAPPPGYYQQLAALSPRIVFLVNFYVCNRNPDRYLPLHLNGQIVAKLRNWLIGTLARDVWMAAECSWQRLQTQQPQGRSPTADEMEAEINEGLGAGAKGIIYFPTAPGSATVEAGVAATPITWPERYDPPVNPAIPARVVAIAARLNPAPPPPVDVVPPLEEIYRRLQALEAWQARVQAK